MHNYIYRVYAYTVVASQRSARFDLAQYGCVAVKHKLVHRILSRTARYGFILSSVNCVVYVIDSYSCCF